MTASRNDVDRWIEQGKEKGATHIVSVCDTWDHDDYPVFVMPGEDANEIKDTFNAKSMQRVNEVITLNEDGTVDEQRPDGLGL